MKIMMMVVVMMMMKKMIALRIYHLIGTQYNMKKGKLKSRNAYLHNSSLSRSHSDSYKQRQQYLVSLKPSVSSDDFRVSETSSFVVVVVINSRL